MAALPADEIAGSSGAEDAPQVPVEAGLKAEPADSEQDVDDEEDVYEVEKIIDFKTEGNEILYRVRWKGYTSDDDTWEPEAHLEDCKEVLLEFRKRMPEVKPKPVKKDTPKLLLHDDIFEAESDSDWQSESKEAVTPKKKKKKSKDEDDKTQDELRKKKSKSGKTKERSRSDHQETSDSLDSRIKKRISESREDLKEIKKQRKEESREAKKLKKEIKDAKVKHKEDYKEYKQQKEVLDLPLESESSVVDMVSQSPDSEQMDFLNESTLEDQQKADTSKDKMEQETIETNTIADGQPDGMASSEEDSEIKMKRKKKKMKKMDKKESKRLDSKDSQFEKKSAHKKQKHIEKVKVPVVPEKPPPPPPPSSAPAPVQKSSKLSIDEKGRKPMESFGEDKEMKKIEMTKEKPRKKNDSEKEIRKEQRGIKNPKETKNAFDAFRLTPEERGEFIENYRKKEESAFDCKPTDESKARENKQGYKERRSTREETDTWSIIASEGDQEVVDSVHQVQDSSDDKQVVSLGMDLQLEWMTLEDFQKHLDGKDEILPTTEPISNNALRDSVKNGDYLTVKYALNSKEEYNLEQEDSSGMTLVMLAAAGGHDDLLRLLIKKGAKVNARQKNGNTALIHAAEKNFLTTVAVLLEAGAHLNIQQNNGETALMKACKRGNFDIVRLMVESGADCNISSKYQSSALHFAKQSNNVMVHELLKTHLDTLSRVAEDTIREYFEARLALLEPIFPIACHRLCEGPDYSLDFQYNPPHKIPEGSGVLLFVFHANFCGKNVVARLCGSCSVHAVVLNDKFQLPLFVDAHFIYSFSPVAGLNKLFIRLADFPTAKVKLLIAAYRVQLQ